MTAKRPLPTLKLPPSEPMMFLQVTIFGFLVYAASYAYTTWMKIPGVLNKSAADTAVILIGLSMLLSAVCYFWNAFDHFIIYRKQLGLIGYAFGVAHLLLSTGLLLGLLEPATWQKGLMWPGLTGLIALVIFSMMAIISHRPIAMIIGNRHWRPLLRTGYIAVFLVLAHVILLKSGRWITWYQGGMKTAPSLSLIVTIFMGIVLLMRGTLELAIRGRKGRR